MKSVLGLVAKTFTFLLVSSLVSFNAYSTGPILVAVKSLPTSSTVLPGYEFINDQAFQVNDGPLKDKYIFFAEKKLGAEQDVVPRFVIASKTAVIDSKELPTLIEGWNIVAVLGVSAEQPKDSKIALRIFAIIALEPMSGRSSDYWNQPFVFDIGLDGKIEENVVLNNKLLKARKSISTLKQLKEFLKTNK